MEIWLSLSLITLTLDGILKYFTYKSAGKDAIQARSRLLSPISTNFVTKQSVFGKMTTSNIPSWSSLKDEWNHSNENEGKGSVLRSFWDRTNPTKNPGKEIQSFNVLRDYSPFSDIKSEKDAPHLSTFRDPSPSINKNNVRNSATLPSFVSNTSGSTATSSSMQSNSAGNKVTFMCSNSTKSDPINGRNREISSYRGKRSLSRHKMGCLFCCGGKHQTSL
nr:hypothetical transcript [Hymenolepis microstoma]